MQHAAMTRLHEPVPLGTAMLSHIALSLFLWNITLRIVGLLFGSLAPRSPALRRAL